LDTGAHSALCSRIGLLHNNPFHTQCLDNRQEMDDTWNHNLHGF
jgi:hypothetical protein